MEETRSSILLRVHSVPSAWLSVSYALSRVSHQVSQSPTTTHEPRRTSTDTLTAYLKASANPHEPHEHWFLHGMEEVRSSILLSSTHSNAALLRWCRICGFGFFVGLVWFGDISARYELRERGLWAEAAVS